MVGDLGTGDVEGLVDVDDFVVVIFVKVNGENPCGGDDFGEGSGDIDIEGPLFCEVVFLGYVATGESFV